ncbi:hypothetical protein [Actinoplanes sp. GCM10030250]|uniref:hypothetical protein n=1 Tax=Actinoplanes sp. GCM10030250 TaxID=3273376 RepID=UPI003622A3BC
MSSALLVAAIVIFLLGLLIAAIGRSVDNDPSSWAGAVIGMVGVGATVYFGIQAHNDSKPTATTVTTEAAPATAGTAATTQATEAANGGISPSAVYHEGSVVVPPGQFANLDAPPDDRQWGQPGGVGAELSNATAYNYLYVYTGGASLVQVDGDSSTVCQDASGYSGQAHITRKKGRIFCAITDEGRYSFVRIAGVRSDGTVELDVRTYAKPDD